MRDPADEVCGLARLVGGYCSSVRAVHVIVGALLACLIIAIGCVIKLPMQWVAAQ